jgi:putative hemolysin
MSLVLWVAALTLVVGWFVAAVTAVRSVSRIWLRHWAQEHGGSGAVRIIALYLTRPDQLLLAGGLGITATAVLIGAALGGREGGTLGLALRLALAAALVLLIGQVVARAVARRWARQLVPVLLPTLQVAALLGTPFFWLGRGVGALVRRRTGRAPRAPARVDSVFRDAAREGVSAEQDAAIVSGVERLGRRVVGDVMTPRAQVFAVDASMPPREMALAIARAAYSRVPVYRGTFDDVVGMVHVFGVYKARPGDPLPIRPVARATAGQACSELLFAMLRDQRHLAIVSDGDGHNVGIVTLEDLLETVVGDIRDEHDE